MQPSPLSGNYVWELQLGLENFEWVLCKVNLIGNLTGDLIGGYQGDLAATLCK